LPDPADREEAYDIPEFELPEDEFGELMWNRRYHRPGSATSSSPPFIPIEEDKALYQPGYGLLRDLPEGMKKERQESVPAAAPTPKSAKTTRASRASAKSGKGTKAAQTAKNVKPPSTVPDSAEDEEEDEEEEEGEGSSESEAEKAPSTRRTNRSGGRVKLAPKRTRKR
jgi:MRG-binding protein